MRHDNLIDAIAELEALVTDISPGQGWYWEHQGSLSGYRVTVFLPPEMADRPEVTAGAGICWATGRGSTLLEAVNSAITALIEATLKPAPLATLDVALEQIEGIGKALVGKAFFWRFIGSHWHDYRLNAFLTADQEGRPHVRHHDTAYWIEAEGGTRLEAATRALEMLREVAA